MGGRTYAGRSATPYTAESSPVPGTCDEERERWRGSFQRADAVVAAPTARTNREGNIGKRT
jgi:hypothetical protein